MRSDLAPDVAALLASLDQTPFPPLRDMPIVEAREALGAVPALFDLPADPSVAVDNVEFTEGERAIAVRLYTPPSCRDRAPVILFMHGGGWVAGDLNSHDSFCRFLARSAHMRVASVDYRRAPETPFPGALEDVAAAAHWLAGGQSPFGAIQGLVLAGDSAGGGLAVAMAGRDDAAGLGIKALLLFYPVLDVARRAQSYTQFAEGFLLRAADMAYFIDCYVPDVARRADAGCSPLLAFDPARTPPVILLTCGHDVLRDEGRAFAIACRESGVPISHVEAQGYIHGIATMRSAVPSAIPYLKKTVEELTNIV